MELTPIPNPEKDQHFLTDQNVLREEILLANLSNKDNVLEIGAGEGFLTELIAKHSGKVLSFEIDERFTKKLNSLQESYPNLQMVYANCLDYSWKGYNKIVSNIPYSLSEPIIMKSIYEGINNLVMIVSEGFKESLESNVNKLGIICNLFYTLKPIMKVPKTSFFPIPRVDSYLITLTRKKSGEKIDEIMKYIIFKQGKIKNAILYAMVNFGKTKKQARDLISNMNFYSEVLEKPTAKITGSFLLKLRKELEVTI